MSARNTRIRALGEIALRVNDLDAMQEFYENVLGLELMKRFPAAAFFRVAEGYGGHTQILALFDRSAEPGETRFHRGTPQGMSADRSTVDHLAFEIDLADFDTEKRRLEQLGIRVETAEHKWVHWRSLYVTDPDGNVVELVCYDETV